MIWSAITAIIPWEWIAGALAGLAALAGAWIAGKRRTALRAENRGLKGYVKTRKAIDDADLGIGAADHERIERLRKFSDGT